MEKKLIFVFFLVFFSMTFVSSAPWIAGYVNDSLDGESANNHIVMVWNPLYGETDNVTDIIGVNGNSNFDHVFMIDCEDLNTPCKVGDVLRVKVIDSGDNYVSNYSVVTITGAGHEEVNDLQLNSLPVSSIVFPSNNYLGNEDSLEFICGFNDLDGLYGEVSLFGNFSGLWTKVETKPVITNNVSFNVSLSEGVFSYTCYANDSLVGDFSENQTIIIDKTLPTITNFTLNESFVCGDSFVRATCETFDEYGISKVMIVAESPTKIYNYSTSNTSSQFYADILLNETGKWNLICFSEDNAGNFYSLNKTVSEYPIQPDLTFGENKVFFSGGNFIEGQNVTINANISNIGCGDVENLSVSFYFGEPHLGNLFDIKNSISLPSFSSINLNSFFSAIIGRNEVFVVIDEENLVSEANETNNVESNLFVVSLWQVFYGEIETSKMLNASGKLSAWGNFSNFEGNIFMADSESQIDWTSLLAIGKNSLGEDANNDLFEIDTLLGTNEYEDSVSEMYASAIESNIIVHNQEILSVPFVESTINSNFLTGILWDSSDDTNGEFDLEDKEDIVFVSNINPKSVGKYGTYDYEIKVPAKLREYYQDDVQDIYLYYELI